MKMTFLGHSSIRQTQAGAAAGLKSTCFSPRQDAISQDSQMRVKTFKKTTFCSFFARGGCNRGEDECNFAHSTAEMRHKPNFKKTRLCEEFMEVGTCTNGLACSFAHGISELRGTRKRQARTNLGKMLGKEAEPHHVTERPAALHQTSFLKGPSDSRDDASAKAGSTSSVALLRIVMAASSCEGKHEEEKNRNEEEGLRWDPLHLGQRPELEAHSQRKHQEHFFEEAMTVKNTFIHMQYEAPLLGLRRSSSSPACFDSVKYHT